MGLGGTIRAAGKWGEAKLRMHRFARFWGVVSLTAGLLAGCSGGAGTQLPPQATAALGPGQVTRGDARAPQPACCARQKTLFVSDAFGGSRASGTVYRVNFATGKVIGPVSPPPEGWNEPQGACVDSGGNAYIANTTMSTVDEYDHGGNFVQSIADPGQYPVSCAYDRSSSSLAISNLISTSGGPGSISIARGGVVQRTYSAPNLSRVYSLAYQDGSGVLWLDGTDTSGVFQYDKFAKGAFTPIPITGGSIAFPGGVAWSGKTHAMNVSDPSASSPTIYQVSPTGQILGATVLDCGLPSGSCGVSEFIIKGGTTVTSNFEGSGAGVAVYAYPAGGKPQRIVGQTLSEVSGLALSPAAP